MADLQTSMNALRAGAMAEAALDGGRNGRQEGDYEKRRLALDRAQWRLELYKTHHEARKPFVESSIKLAELTIRSLLILNGGASLGLLALAGNAAANERHSVISSLAPSLEWFGWGAMLSVLTAGFAYVAQRSFLRPSSNTKWSFGTGLVYLAILAGTLSLLFFVLGVSVAASGLRS